MAPKKRGPGRPKTTGTGTPVMCRVNVTLLTRVDTWRRAQPDMPTRPQAILRLAERALAALPTRTRRSPKAAAKASELAGEQIDKLIDPSAPAEEKHRRKRRLLKGPGEFREIRGDLAKPKR
jgi:hypothetical protein